MRDATRQGFAASMRGAGDAVGAAVAFSRGENLAGCGFADACAVAMSAAALFGRA